MVHYHLRLLQRGERDGGDQVECLEAELYDREAGRHRDVTSPQVHRRVGVGRQGERVDPAEDVAAAQFSELIDEPKGTANANAHRPARRKPKASNQSRRGRE